MTTEQYSKAQLPPSVAALVGSAACTPITIGMSGAAVLSCGDAILKIQPDSEDADREAQAMVWLRGRLPVPEVLCYEKRDGKSFLLMSRLPGRMSCDREHMADPDGLTTILAEALNMLWAVDLRGCPLFCDLDEKLDMARYNVTHGLVDVDNVEPETFGPGGFRDPAHLLSWLEEHRPAEELVLSHGDFCLPNIFIDNGRVSGFLDLGKTGAADRYQDIALCYRSLRHNYTGKYSSGIAADFDPDILFQKLGIVPNREKIRYYTLLDELF